VHHCWPSSSITTSYFNTEIEEEFHRRGDRTATKHKPNIANETSTVRDTTHRPELKSTKKIKPSGK